jgi:hypothetical protein
MKIDDLIDEIFTLADAYFFYIELNNLKLDANKQYLQNPIHIEKNFVEKRI